MAVLKYLSEYNDTENVKNITCYLLDGEQAWADTWSELDVGGDIFLRTNFQRLDVTQPETWKYQKNFRNADLFILSYFVSEIINIDKSGAANQFFCDLIKDAKSGSLFIYVDNGHEDFNAYFDNLCEAEGLQCLLESTNVKFTPRFDEQASSLDNYISKFGRHPKIQAFLSYRVLKKP